MAMQTTKVDASEFERFATLPENADRLFELIGGEIIEVVSNGVSSALGSSHEYIDRRLRPSKAAWIYHWRRWWLS